MHWSNEGEKEKKKGSAYILNSHTAFVDAAIDVFLWLLAKSQEC